MVCITDENGGVRFCPKLAKQKPPRIGNLFEESSFLTPVIYALLGVLAGLLLIGTLWDIIRKKRRINQNAALGEDMEITRSNMRAYVFFFRVDTPQRVVKIVQSISHGVLCYFIDIEIFYKEKSILS